ncbi:MAG: aminoacyl-tRNA deacylase [Pseudomonadota bacterium]
MAKNSTPVTPAIRALQRGGVAHRLLPYDYVDSGGARQAAQALGVSCHHVVKTLIFEADGKRPLIVLMHGDCEVSTKTLARLLGVKRIVPCAPKMAEKLTGYRVGGISPFGLRQPLPVYVESSILGLPRVYINGGKRGLLVEIAPAALSEFLAAVSVSTATDG